MQPHYLVSRLRFTRSEFQRGLDGVTDVEALRRFGALNSISWIVGHLANQENRWWGLFAQGKDLLPELNGLVGFNQPASTPPLAEMWQAWRIATHAADTYLDTLTPTKMLDFFTWNDKPFNENVGTMLMRCIDHYWYHLGEASAIRQLLGYTNLPVFVGEAPVMYHPE
jgi:uncharacterized damage-inducible protein DinB